MKEAKKDISVVVPVFNEEGNINELYSRLVSAILKITNNYEIIFVNDGSKDTSILLLKQLATNDENVFYINFSRNFGHQIAVSAGIKHVNARTIVIIDGDLQDPPELITELYETYQKGYDIVYAKRKERKGETFLKKITAKVFYRLLSKITSFEIPLDTGDYRLLDEKIVKALNNMPEQNKFLRGQIAWLGFKHTYVLFDRDSRRYGKTNYTYSKMISFALDGITSFSDKPLLWVSRAGFFISFLSFCVILLAIFSHFVLQQTITGWTSLIISTMFIGGVQLLSIGIIGEYISRINKNVQDRPLYIIEETNIKT